MHYIIELTNINDQFSWGEFKIFSTVFVHVVYKICNIFEI